MHKFLEVALSSLCVANMFLELRCMRRYIDHGFDSIHHVTNLSVVVIALKSAPLYKCHVVIPYKADAEVWDTIDITIV